MVDTQILDLVNSRPHRELISFLTPFSGSVDGGVATCGSLAPGSSLLSSPDDVDFAYLKSILGKSGETSMDFWTAKYGHQRPGEKI